MTVVIGHFNWLFGGDVFFPGRSDLAVKGFFVLSGFLVTYSFLTSSDFKNYAEKRIRRIFPSYLTVVVLCALLLVGVSRLSVGEYFMSADWWKYLLVNVATLNFLHPDLPGVFEGTAVNGSLWTIKVELTCYMLIPLFLYLGRKSRKRMAVVIVASIVMSILFSYGALYMYGRTGSGKWLILERQIFGQIAYFFCGSLFCIFFERLRAHLKVFLIVGAVLMILTFTLDGFAPLLKPFACTLVFIPLSMIGKWGNLAAPFDFSYELYLVHFPIINLLAHWSVEETLGMAGAFSLAVVLSCFSAFILWNFVGRKFLRRSAPRLSRQSA